MKPKKISKNPQTRRRRGGILHVYERAKPNEIVAEKGRVKMTSAVSKRRLASSADSKRKILKGREKIRGSRWLMRFSDDQAA